MSAETRHQQEVEETRKRKAQLEQDKAINANIDSQNARLERLIKNYKLTRQWRRIMWRTRLFDRVKRIGNTILSKLKSWNPFAKKQKITPAGQN